MKLRILVVERKNSVAIYSNEVFEKLKNVFAKKQDEKFVLFISADPEEESFETMIGISIGSLDHGEIETKTINYIAKNKNRPLIRGPNILGGGNLKIEKENLIFFGTSRTYCKYSEEVLKKHKDFISKTFKVSKILFK